MNIRHLPFLFFLFAVQHSAAGKANDRPLDLDVDPSAFYREPSNGSTWYRDDNNQSPEQRLSSHCQELMNEIKAMKGKPQRKFTLQQRYEADCVDFR